MKLRFYFLLLISAYIPMQLWAQPQPIKFKYLTNDQGLSQNSVKCIEKDKQGFMWFGTNGGLNRYDGYTFSIYQNDSDDSTSINSNVINDLLVDSYGNLWVGTNLGLDKFDSKTNRFVHYNPVNTKIFVQDIFEDAKGSIWIGTREGLLLFNPGNPIATRFKSYQHNPTDSTSIANNEVIKIIEDEPGDLWLATRGGVDRFHPGSTVFIHYKHHPDKVESLGGELTRTLYKDSQNNIWIGIEGAGLDLYNRKTNSFTHFRHDPTDKQSLSINNVLSINEGIAGRLWVGTENGGLNIFDAATGTFTAYVNNAADKTSLGSNSVRCIYKDEIGNVWVGTWTGGVNFVSRYGDKFTHYQPTPYIPNGLNNKTAKAFFEDRDGKIWIGTDGGGLNVWDRKTDTFTYYQHDDDQANSVSSNTIHSIIAISEDTLAIGYHTKGFDLLNRKTGKIVHFYPNEERPGEIPVKTVFSIHADKANNLWIGTAGSGMHVFNRKTHSFTHYLHDDTDPKSISSNSVYTVMQDKEGNMWFGTENGLNRFDRKTNGFVKYQHDHKNKRSLSNNIVYSVREDSKGNVWVATAGGLNVLNKKTQDFTSYTQKNGLPDNVIYGILEDRKGNLWLSTNKGIAQFNTATKKFRNYSTADGLQANEFKRGAYYQTSKGEMFFGGINGFNVFHPDSVRDNPVIPRVVLTGLQIFNKPVTVGTADSPLQEYISEATVLTLPYYLSVFTFEYAALNYILPEKNQYAFKLNGFDKDWNYVGSTRSATYTNLDPGEYTFLVKGSNNDGIWNPTPTAIKLIITPPFWQTWWFKLLIAAGIIGGAYSFYRRRINVIKAQKAELEKQVKERTSEVVLQKEELQTQAEHLQLVNEELRESQEEIQVQRDNIQRVNEHIMSSIRYANTIQQAILPESSTLQQFLPEHFVIYRPKDVVSGDFYWFTHISKETAQTETDLTFIAAIDCTGHGVPGAFMSIIGYTLLNEIINQKHIFDPGQILEQLNLGVQRTVGTAEGVSASGMDVCLCCLQKGEGNQTRVLYGGAKRPLIYVKPEKGSVERIEGDRKSIGSQNKVAFTTKELLLEQGSTLYLTTDGYMDQNNPSREKFGSAKLKQLVAEAVSKPLVIQQQIFEDALDNHQQTAEQRDDITLLGIRV